MSAISERLIRRTHACGSPVARSAIALALAALLIAGTITGCAADAPPDADAGIIGSITSMDHLINGELSMLVEGGPQAAGALSDKAQVAVTTDTRIFDARGKRIGMDALKAGLGVRVWFTGPVAESYPIQGEAAAIQLVR